MTNMPHSNGDLDQVGQLLVAKIKESRFSPSPA